MCLTKLNLYQKVRSDLHSAHTRKYSYKLAFRTASAHMEQLTSDLSGIAVYFNNILVSGKDAEDHLHNLQELLKRLDSNGLRYRMCLLADASHISKIHPVQDGLAKGPKVDAVMQMPPPKDIPTLRSFLGSIQFYGKFLPDLATVMEPLTSITRKDTRWKWTAAEQDTLDTPKSMLNKNIVLAHFNPSCPIHIFCNASKVGMRTVHFHCYSDGSERPITNAYKTLSQTQEKYLQIQKEALVVTFGLHKFHQFFYGRQLILVTDYRPSSPRSGHTRRLLFWQQID